MAVVTERNSAELTADEYADRIVAATKLTGLVRLAQQTSNEVATPYFGTTRYTKPRAVGPPLVYDPESGEYVEQLSRQGAKVAGGLLRATAAYAVRQNKDRLPTVRKAGAVAGVLATGAVVVYVYKYRKP